MAAECCSGVSLDLLDRHNVSDLNDVVGHQRWSVFSGQLLVCRVVPTGVRSRNRRLEVSASVERLPVLLYQDPHPDKSAD